MFGPILLVYLAGLFHNITAAALTLTIFAAVGYVAWFIFAVVQKHEYRDDSVMEALKASFTKWRKALILLVLLAVFLPSQTIMYIAAGLETSKIALNSDIGHKAYKLLEEKLDQALKTNTDTEGHAGSDQSK